MNIISPDTIYTEVSLADEERGLLRKLLRMELAVPRNKIHMHRAEEIVTVSLEDSDGRRFIRGIIDKLEENG